MCENKEQQGCGTDKIETMKDKLELQLHEQYAINNNANVSSFIAMIGALIIAFTGYGYVLYQYLMSDVCCCKMANAETMVHISTFAVLVVIFILYMVAIEVGAGQRSNQFVIHNIRKKAYNYNNEELEEIYPEGYTPEGKDYFTFVQGIYNTLSWIFWGIYAFIAILSFGVIVQNCCGLSVCAIMWLYMISFRCSKFAKYRKQNSNKTVSWLWRIIFPLIIVVLSVWGIIKCSECEIRCIFAIVASATVFTIIDIFDNRK